MNPRTHVRMADNGLRFLAPNAQPRFAQAPVATGYIYPTRIYDRMRAINANAQRLDANMQAYVTNGALRAGWDDGAGGGWYPAWKPFYERYAGPNASEWAKLGAAFDTAELSAEVDRRERELDSLVAEYNTQRQPNGAAVPQIAALALAPLADESFIPWWFWVIGGVAIAGAGWLIYRKVQEGRAKQRYAEGKILPMFFGEEGAKTAQEFQSTGRDISRDRDAIYEPFSLAHFARDPAPMHVHVHTGGHSMTSMPSMPHPPRHRPTHHRGFSGDHKRGSWGHDPAPYNEPRVTHLPPHFDNDRNPFHFSHDDEYDIPGLDYDYEDQ